MRIGLVLACCVLAAAPPARARAELYDLQPGQAFAVAGTREGCASKPTAAQPLLTCSLWGRTTRVIPGTLYFELGDAVADIYQRTLSGAPGLLREYAQPPQAAQPAPAPAGDPVVFVVEPGDAVSVAGTNVACVVARRRGDLGVTCRNVEAATGLPLSTSVAVTLSELAVTAMRIRADRSGSTTFALAQPLLPSARAVARGRRALIAALGRLATIRRTERRFSAHGYAGARSGLLGVIGDLDHDRLANACLGLEPLLYDGFYLPRGHTRLLFVRRLRKIDRALCR
ncbi:MAG TPA: hypothetical protein VF101_00085 [Gaiellaceae bacterium]